MAHFNIYCDDGEQIRSIAFPKIDGLTWHTNVSGSQTNIINGKVSTSRSVGFTVSATGEIAIPKIRVETSEGERFTQAVKFTVGKLSTGMFRKDGSEMPIDEAVFCMFNCKIRSGNNILSERKSRFTSLRLRVRTSACR